MFFKAHKQELFQKIQKNQQAEFVSFLCFLRKYPLKILQCNSLRCASSDTKGATLVKEGLGTRHQDTVSDLSLHKQKIN